MKWALNSERKMGGLPKETAPRARERLNGLLAYPLTNQKNGLSPLALSSASEVDMDKSVIAQTNKRPYAQDTCSQGRGGMTEHLPKTAVQMQQVRVTTCTRLATTRIWTILTD